MMEIKKEISLKTEREARARNQIIVEIRKRQFKQAAILIDKLRRYI